MESRVELSLSHHMESRVELSLRCGCGGVVSAVEGGGPYRSGHGESIWVRQKSLPEKLSGDGRGGGRRRLPEIWERERGLGERKAQNRIKTGQKRETCRSPEQSKAVPVKKARKTKKIQLKGSKYKPLKVVLRLKRNTRAVCSREIEILVFLSAYFIALREDTQHLSMGDFGNGYSRKRQKQGNKRQNQTHNGKDRKRQSHSEPKVKSQSPRSTKVNLMKVKVNPGNVKVNLDEAEAEK
nr:hypothetical protein [Tanacetum cinerariifolium]